MNPDLFKNSSAGRCRRQREGYYAFLPNSLPPKLEIDWKFAQLLSQADVALGELSGVGRLLPNPHLLIQPYLRREAVLSSRIENTLAGMSDLFFFEADDSESPKVPDVREVANYVRALKLGLERIKELPICGRLIREIHKELMENVRGGASHSTPGEFRHSQNWIGPAGCSLMEATYVPPPVDEMQKALVKFEKYLNEKSNEPVLVQCALMHYQFEAIHPFLDGNGRVGRLLITFVLCERGLLTQPLLYLSAFFEKHRDEYYRRLLAVSQNGDWRGWIEYFLRGVANQAKEAVKNANAILDLHERYMQKIQSLRSPQSSRLIVNHLFTNPIISIPKLAKAWKSEYIQVQRGVLYLEKLGILGELTGRKRNRLYVARELLTLLTGTTENKKNK